jgi:NADPH-dependent 2,4-dienoyl-CoA reductase/sulfur reductase-like enzyme
MHLLIVGGSDAGISAALRAHELDPGAEITIVLADDYPNSPRARRTENGGERVPPLSITGLLAQFPDGFVLGREGPDDRAIIPLVIVLPSIPPRLLE